MKTYRLNFCEVVKHNHEVIIESDMDYNSLNDLLVSIEMGRLNCLDDYIQELSKSGINIKEVNEDENCITTSIRCNDID